MRKRRAAVGIGEAAAQQHVRGDGLDAELGCESPGGDRGRCSVMSQRDRSLTVAARLVTVQFLEK